MSYRGKMRFCSKCGSHILPGSIICSGCGHVMLYEDKDLFLSFMERLLSKEKDEERKKVIKDRVEGKVIDVGKDTITIECKFSKFEEGDVICYIEGDIIKPLGVVLGGGRILTVGLYMPLNFKEDQILELCENEVLVGYELQLDLLKKIKNGELRDFEQNAVAHVFEKYELQGLCKIKPSNVLDVRDGFSLDDSQLEAVEYALGLKDGESLIIIGPPGTGKTRVIAKIAYELSRRGEKVLITSHTNRAVDNALELLPIEITLRVGRPEKVLQSIRPYLLSYKARTELGLRLENLENEISSVRREIDEFYHLMKEFYKLGHWEKYEVIKERLRSARSRLKELCEERNRMLREECEKLVREARIIGSTLIKSQLQPLVTERFDMVLIDECSQVSTTLALLGMIKARKWVLVGDHKQLLPIFQTLDIKDKRVQEKLSVFCYMLEKYNERSIWLRWHYRSNSEIIGFSSRYVYNGEIAPVEACKSIKLNINSYPDDMEFLKPDLPVVFLHVNGMEFVRSDGSRFNEAEAKVVQRIVYTLKSLGVRDNEIGIITPYRAQRDYIKELLKDDNIEVNTVDSFQGREKDVIVFTITSTRDMSFVEDENRLNVAFTRARRKLIVVGNAGSIHEENGLLFAFLSYVKEKNGYFVIQD